MRVTMIITVTGFNGAVTTFTDACVELRARGVDADLYVLCLARPSGSVNEVCRPMRSFIVDALRTFTVGVNAHVLPFDQTFARRLLTAAAERGPVVICRDTLMHLLPREQRCVRHLVLLYPLLVRAARGVENWTLAAFNDLLATHGVVTVGNLVNQPWVAGGAYVHWPVGLARARVDHLRSLAVDTRGPLTTAAYNAARNGGALNAFEHTVYVYRRREVAPGLTYENIGKLVFEFMLCGKPVRYSAAGKLMNDGLTEMLARFAVDDDLDQVLRIPVADLEHELLDQPFDDLLGIINQVG